MLLIKRLAASLLVLFAAAVFTFVLIRLLPGDPVAHLAGGMQASPEALAALRHQMGLDQSIGTQLVHYLLALLHGDWGTSFNTGQPVLDDLHMRFPATLELTSAGFLVSLIIAVPLGLAAATRINGIADRCCQTLSSVGSSLPTFFVALLLIYIFYFRLGWAPEPSGRLGAFASPPPVHTGSLLIDALLAGDRQTFFDALAHLALPAMSMALFGIPPIAKITRNAVVQTLAAPPMRTAASLGLSRWTALYHYALLPAAPAIITALGMIFSYMLGANVVVEKVFAWPGIGAYALDALSSADYAPLQGFILAIAIAFAILNLIVDLMVAWLDPRSRSMR